MKKVVLVFILSPLFLIPHILLAHPLPVLDTCTVNDDCQQAIVIANVVTDAPFVCVEGCNLYASPESIQTNCEIQTFPTVWYKVTLDNSANLINLFVNNADFESPTISLFQSETDCDSLVPVHLTSNNLDCVVGTNGEAEALGTSATPNTTYYIAISSLNSIGGHFDFCMNAISTGSACVVDRNIQVTARSHVGPLEGPFDPNETISICMNVNEYTAAGNGCQWFQGIVPVFGNGWDPSSFDSIGQPLNATMNGVGFGVFENGLYGATTWDWFDSVDYHYDNPYLTIADLDGNGRLDICNSQYEMDCPNTGVTGGCCGPCWGSPVGTILPPGWFAYGINGTCPTPGPPIGVDWGDGNTCGDGMGPWQFCFELVTRDVPDCLSDTTKRDLSLGFFTFADGEVGSWIGSASVCALDRPMKMSLQAKCGRVVTHTVEELPPLCSGDTLYYPIYDPTVSEWEWNISPFWAVPYVVNHGSNGFVITAPLINTTDEPINISGVLIGHVKASNDMVIRNFKFTLHDAESCPLVDVEEPMPSAASLIGKVMLYPVPAQESVWLQWANEIHSEAVIEIFNSQGMRLDSELVFTGEGNKKLISTQDLLPGVYILAFSNGDFRSLSKLVKL